MSIKQHYEDSIYNAGATAEVFQGKPSVEIGNEGDEKWCWVDGEGLFLAKKYNGEWRFFTSSTELLEAGVISGDSSSAGGGSGSTVAQTGQFVNLTVTNSSSLQTSTGISGTLSVTATTLTAFPHSDNLSIDSSQHLDTIQGIKTSNHVQFNSLGLGQASSDEAGNIELTSILGVNAATIINKTLYLSQIDYTTTGGSPLTDGLGFEQMTQFEATQLKKIDSTAISSDQWGYVGGMDQHVAEGSDVVFKKASLTETGKTWSFDPIGSAGGDAGLTTGGLQITTDNTADAPIIIGGGSFDDHTVRNYAYTSGMFLGTGWSIYEDNNLHNMEIDNLQVRGTLSVYELLIQQIRATNGSVFITSAAKLGTDDKNLKLGVSGPVDDSLTIVDGGNSYTSLPTLNILYGGGSGATASATVLSGGKIVAVSLTNGGSGYTSSPYVGISGGGGTGANITATVSAGQAWVLTFETDEDNDKPHPFADGDLILARRCDISGDTTDIVSEVRFTVTDANGGNASQLYAELKSSSITLPSSFGEETAVLNGFDFVRVGNTTDANRQGGIYLTSDDTLAPFIDIFDEVSSWQEWDGITNIFGLADGSFDLATVGTHTGDSVVIPGSSWYSLSPGSGGNQNQGDIEIASSGGVSNQKYCKLDTNGNNTCYIYQPITFPYIATGDYTVIIEWYGKQDPVTATNEPRVCVRNVFPGASTMGFNAAGVLLLNTNAGLIDWEDITQPSNQPATNKVWHKYQYKLTVPSTMFSNGEDKVMKLMFATANTTAATNVWIDDVKIHMEGKVKTRIGRLEGVGKAGYGLWGENVYLKGRIEASEGYIGNEFMGWRIDSTGITNEGTQSYISAGQSSAGLDNGGAYISGEGDLSLGNSDTSGLKWIDETNTLTVRGTIHVDSTGSVDASLVPSSGQNLKIASGGLGMNTANIGVFKADANGEIVSQVGGAPSSTTDYTYTMMVWDSATNSLDTTFDSDGVKHHIGGIGADVLATDINALDNGTLVGIAVHYNAYHHLNDESVDLNSDLVSALKKCGGSSFYMNSTSEFASYILLGIKQAADNTKGTELVSIYGDSNEPHHASITANFKDNVIDILDWEGSLEDFDAESPKSFKFSNASGFKFYRTDLDSSNWFSMISFPMPYIKSGDTANLTLFFISKNLSDEGVGAVRLYLNGEHVSGVSDLALQDADGTTEFAHHIDNIPSNLFKVDPGEVNVFQLKSYFNGTTTDTQYIYDFELRDSTTQATYTGGAGVSPEGNLALNGGFEDITGTNSVPNWSDNNRGGGTGYVADTTEKMTGMQSLKHISGASPTYQSYIYQTFPFKTNTFYTLRFNFRWEDDWTGSTSGSGVLGELPKFSIYAPDIEIGSGVTEASFDIDTDDGTVTWYNSKKWNPFSLIGSIANSATGSWQTFEYQFQIPLNAPQGQGNTAIANPTNFQVFLYSGEQANQTVWFDAVQLFEHENFDQSVTPEETGLYLTGERLGYYNGSGGLYGWSSVIKNDGSFFFGSPHEQANLLSPGSGGPYIRFTGETLEVNANMVAGIIQSENLTATTGTRISLADGSMTTKGTNTDSGLVLDSAGNLELNGATLDGGTITGQLMQSNYAEGAVTFVTKLESGVNTNGIYTTTVNGVNRLICDRIVESAEANFGESDSHTGGTTKYLGMYPYDYQGVSTFNRAADTDANSNVSFTGGAPFYICTAATNDGNGENDELVQFRFRIGGVQDIFYAYTKTRIRPTSPNRGYVLVRGKVGSGSYTNVISKDSSNDFYMAGTASWTLPSGLVVYCFATSDYQDAGDIIDMKSQWYIVGTTDGMYNSTNGLEIYVKQEGNGSHVQTSTTNFGPSVWKIYN